MAPDRVVFRFVLVLAALLAALPAAATTLIHQGLDQLVHDNELVIQGTVSDLYSYWNADHSVILTDVRVRPTQVIKGTVADPTGDVTFTVLGGAVGDVTVLLVDGPDLVAGSDYVLFLTHAGLPGAPNRLTIRDQAQGVFDVVQGRAVSQADWESLVPDARGRIDVPGGDQGMELQDLLTQIRGYVDR